MFTVITEFQTADAFQIHNCGPVNAAETSRVEIFFQLRHATPKQVRFCAHVKTCVIVCGFDPIDLGNVDERDLTGTLDGETIEYLRGRVSVCNSFLGTRKGALESCIVEGLQEIVERTGLKGAQCVLIVSGDEDDGGGNSAPSNSSTSKPSHSGICTSRKTRSGFLLRISARASAPEPHSADDFDS